MSDGKRQRKKARQNKERDQQTGKGYSGEEGDTEKTVTGNPRKEREIWRRKKEMEEDK